MDYIAEYVTTIESGQGSGQVEIPVGDFVVQPGMGTVAWYVGVEADSVAEARQKLEEVTKRANTPKAFAGFTVSDGWSLYELTDTQGNSWLESKM